MTTLMLNSIPNTITPLIRRHAQDAAFYWSQIDGSLNAATLTVGRAQHFGRLLQAHLDGLIVARQEGMQVAQQALERWKKPGEAFTAMWLALQRAYAATQWLAQPELAAPIDSDGTLPQGIVQALAAQQMPAQIFALAQKQPDLLLRGIISALAWVPEQVAQAWMQQAFASAQPVALVAALRACELRRLEVSPWAAHAQHMHPCVRAAACRCASAQDVPVLQNMLSDDELAVRAEAAIALIRLFSSQPENALASTQALQRSALVETAASTLGACVLQQSTISQQATGWDHMQSQRRLRRWLCHLAHAWPVGHPHVKSLLAHLPMREALCFALHHGDQAYLPLTIEAMQEPRVSRLAGWVWQSLTGIDIEQQGCVLPEPALDLDGTISGQRLDPDQGLPLPNPAAIAALQASLSLQAIPVNQRILLGQQRTAAQLARLLNPAMNKSQALRAVAHLALSSLQAHDPPAGIRARASVLMTEAV
jgi:hypothetical protein